MDAHKILDAMLDHFEDIMHEATEESRELWQQFITLHAADIARFLSNISLDYAAPLFSKCPRDLQIDVFSSFSDTKKIDILSALSDSDRAFILKSSPADEVTDIFAELSDEELKHYLRLLSYHDRQEVLSLMEHNPHSAAGIMDTHVITFRDDFTVEKAIHILQRLQPKQELYQQIYVVNEKNQLMGHVRLEDLVLKHPKDRLATFMYKNELVAKAAEDQEAVAKKMIHYKQMAVPVVGDNNVFLGIIPSETLVEVLEEEASEDVYHISAMAALSTSYFEMPFFRLLWERGAILVTLLLAQTFSTMILDHFSATICGFFMLFSTMLVSTGGNSSSQTSALVIQGMASGEINRGNVPRFLFRELRMAGMMALILGIVAFVRIYIIYGNATGSFAVSLSLSVIVLFSVVLGSGIPILLKRFGLDPAFAAGPFLATLMDIMGLLIYCSICSFFLSA
jgi:magnesium transporter